MIDPQAVNINADVGEGAGNDALVIPHLYSCNISCGAHAGNTDSIKNALYCAVKNEVKIGAHPGYPDKDNFGRKKLDLTDEHLKETINEQLYNFQKLCTEAGGEIHHIKFHGALYNESAKNKALAEVLLSQLIELKVTDHLYAPHNSAIAELASRKLQVSYEAFIDRNYENDGLLRSRNKENTLISNPEEILGQLKQLINRQTVKTINGEELSIKANTFCIHGDHPKVVEALQLIKKHFQS